MTPVLTFDIETIPDTAGIRKLHDLPADLWHIHNAILNEVSCSYDPTDCWGAQIPPGIDAVVGVRRELDDNDNLDIFQAQIWAFRQWLAGRGYGGLPVVLSEFGVLMPESYGFDPARVNAFMSGTFDFLATAADPLLGDPLDGGHLVQRWAWFSLDVLPFETSPTGFNGNLFDPATTAITAYGLHYEELTAGLPALDYAELALVRWQVPALGRPLAPGETVSLPLTVRLGNSGTSRAVVGVNRLMRNSRSKKIVAVSVLLIGSVAPAQSTGPVATGGAGP